MNKSYTFIKFLTLIICFTFFSEMKILAQCSTCTGVGDGSAANPAACAAATKAIGPGSYADFPVTANTTYTLTLGTQSSGPSTVSGITAYAGTACTGATLATNTTGSPYTITFSSGANTNVRIVTCRAGTWPANNIGQGSATLSYQRVQPGAITATPNNTSVCSGTAPSIALSEPSASNTNGTTVYSWTLGTNIGAITGASASSGSPISQTLTNPSNSSAGSIQYVVTATNGASGCAGAATNTQTVTVNPKPSVTNGATSSTCSGASPNITLTSSAPSSFAWTLGTNTGAITGASASSGASINQTLTNPSNSAAGSIVYAVTPTATTGSCVGAASNITVTVNPTPAVTNGATANTCSGTSPNITLTSSTPSSFAWSLGTNTGAITGASASSGASINQTLTNPSNSAAGSIVYSVTPTATAGSCVGSASNITVTVNPKPAVTNSSSSTICSGTSPNITLTSSAPSSFAWTIGTITGSITGASASSGATINQTLTNPGTTQGSLQYLVTPTATTGSCSGSAFTITVFVDPAVSITSPPAHLCVSSTYTYAANISGGTWSNTGNGSINSSSGLFTPTSMSAGTPSASSTITYAKGTCSANASLTVDNTASITSSNAAMCVGSTRSLTASIVGGTFSGTGVSGTTFTAPNPGVATFQDYVITYTISGSACTAPTQTIRVWSSSVAPTSASVSATPLCSGSTTTLSYLGGTLAPGATATWHSGSCGGSNVGTGNSLTLTPPVGVTDYYINFVDPAPCSTSSSCAGPATVTVRGSSANATLPTTGNNGQSLTESCTESGWTYYTDPSDATKWLFAIKKNGNTFIADVKITTNGSGTYVSTHGATGHENGSYLLSRYWNVNVTSGSISTPVDVKYYYSTTDSTSTMSTMNSGAAAVGCPTGNRSGWRWFKSVGADYNPSNIQGNRFNFTNITLSPAAYGTDNGTRYVQFNSIASFSGGSGGSGFNNGAPGIGLPVKLVSFTADPINDQFIRTQWITETEIDNSGFYLERSTDAINFESIGWIPGAGNSTTQQVYTLDDKKVVPNTIYYYRLKQVDVDGKFEYFDIVSAKFMGANGFVIESLRPNPATGNVTIQVISNVDVASKVVMTDMLGRKVLEQEWNLSQGFNGTQIDLSDVSGGTYNVTIYSGSVTTTRRLVVAR